MAPPVNVTSVGVPAAVDELSEAAENVEIVGVAALVGGASVEIVATVDIPGAVDPVLLVISGEIDVVASDVETADVLSRSEPVVAEGPSKVEPVGYVVLATTLLYVSPWMQQASSPVFFTQQYSNEAHQCACSSQH